jgi:AcrR family transcriptional regulator
VTTPAASRREQILASAAELFAQRGFHGVSVADLGAAVGVSGPALYRHFPSKDAMLAEMLVSISEELLAVGRARVDAAANPRAALEALVAWHTDFALHNKPLIVVQDRDWDSLPDAARERVRSLQLAYVELWADELRALHPGVSAVEARARAHAAFGLLNSTPRISGLDDQALSAVLREMALSALHPAGSGPGVASA